MVTILKKDSSKFVKEFAKVVKAKLKFRQGVDSFVGVMFDDIDKTIYLIHKSGLYINTDIQCFKSLWYNNGNNALIAIKKEAIAIDLVNNKYIVAKTKFIKK